MTDLYRDIIIDHYRNPRNFGSLSKPDRVYEQVNVLCGDKIHIEIALLGGKKDPVIDNIRFTGAFFRWLIFERLNRIIFATGGFVLFILGIPAALKNKAG